MRGRVKRLKGYQYGPCLAVITIPLPAREMSSTSEAASPATGTAKGSRFWLSFIAVVVCNFLSALDTTAVSTALPTITKELNGGDEFVWVGSAYGLASAAIMPSTGKLADIVGRRPIMMGYVAIFFLGSALSGSAKSMTWLIAARSERSSCT